MECNTLLVSLHFEKEEWWQSIINRIPAERGRKHSETYLTLLFILARIDFVYYYEKTKLTED